MFLSLRKSFIVGAASVAVVLFAGSGVAQTNQDTFTDPRDGKIYRIVQMPDGKTWMAENLNFATSSESWCYGNNAANCNTYGRLYSWRTAMTICPAGWHLPSEAEWDALALAVGGRQTAGTKLKSSSGWRSYRKTPLGTDEFGFSALPGGNRSEHWSNKFYSIGSIGHWWTTTESVTRDMFRSNESVRTGEIRNYDVNGVSTPTVGVSVRCVRDD